VEKRVAELEAATQALRGYVGNVRSVNERVEERADAALARAEELDGRVTALEASDDAGSDPSLHGEPSAADDGGPRPAASSSSSDRPSEASALSPADDPPWLAAADDRLPDEESPAEAESEGSGDSLAARLGQLL
jgi:hypothetical protein